MQITNEEVSSTYYVHVAATYEVEIMNNVELRKTESGTLCGGYAGVTVIAGDKPEIIVQSTMMNRTFF